MRGQFRTYKTRENKRGKKPQKSEKQGMDGNEGVWKGQAAHTHTHLAARARKAQLVKVLEGHREEGAEQSWEWLVEALQCWAELLSASGCSPGPPSSRLWASSPVSQSQELLPGFNR